MCISKLRVRHYSVPIDARIGCLDLISTKSIGVPHILTKNVGVPITLGTAPWCISNVRPLEQHQWPCRVVDLSIGWECAREERQQPIWESFYKDVIGQSSTA